MSCKHECTKPPVFPKDIVNRPGLDHIDYRIGTYADLRAHMLDRLNKEPALVAWTHRGADDPGIALLESAAAVGDALTFYQELDANEAYLRTAEWRESITELVRLLGYRLSPGIGGLATFALAVKGDKPVTVSRGFGFKAPLEGLDAPAEFESVAEATTYPHLSRFSLYRPRLAPANITAGLDRLELHAVNGLTDVGSVSAVAVKAGDRLMLVPDATMFDVTGTAYTAQKKAEIVVVSEVKRVLDRTIITFKGSLIETRGTTVTAYKIGRTFRHFGHNTPAFTSSFNNTTQRVTQTATDFERDIYGTHNPAAPGAAYYTTLLENEMPLDQKVDDLAVGGKLIVQGFTKFDGITAPVPFIVVKSITSSRSDSVAWGNLAGASTMALTDKKLIANDSILNEVADIRRIVFHEVLGPKLTLRAPSAWDSGAFTAPLVSYYGTYAQVKTLAGRSLFLVGSDGTVQSVQVTNTVSGFSTTGKDEIHPWMWSLTLNSLPVFPREAFDEQQPTVTVYGNLVDTTQGKTQDETVLGSGDRRQAFQTFALPKPPLTYLLDETRTPAETPEVSIYVDHLLWTQVDTLFNAGPNDQVYVVREDKDGKSYVQFGDGITGARLPSGRNNVVACFRSGSGASGPLKKDATPAATGKLSGLDKVYLPSPATGGAKPESEDNARAAAPGRIQSLGRLVSLADYEAEALAIPNVIKVRATWAAPDGTTHVRLTVLTESGNAADVAGVKATMRTYNRCRGPARFPIVVVQGVRQFVHLKIVAAFDPTRREADIKAATKIALGMSGEEGNGVKSDQGLFSESRRQFGQNAHISQIIAAVQQVVGVDWVTIEAAQLIPLGSPQATDPTTLAVPSTPVVNTVLSCDDDFILALHSHHLILNLSQSHRAKGCEP